MLQYIKPGPHDPYLERQWEATGHGSPEHSNTFTEELSVSSEGICVGDSVAGMVTTTVAGTEVGLSLWSTEIGLSL